MKRILAIGALGACVLASTVSAPPASAAVPKPDPRAVSTATYAEVGMPNAAEVKAALGWPAEHPMTVTNELNPTTHAGVRRSAGNPWIAEKVSNFQAEVTTPWLAGTPLRPYQLQTGLRQTTALRDRDFTRLMNLLRAGSTEFTIVSSSSTEVTYIWWGWAEGVAAATTVKKAGPNALVQSLCYSRANASVTGDQAKACTEPTAQLLKERYVAGWPAISAHWPSPNRRLVLPAISRMKDRLLTARQVHNIGGTRRLVPRVVTQPEAWRVTGSVVIGERRWFAEIDLLRAGDAPAARTELAYRYRGLRGSVVRANDNSFTAYRNGHATTWKRLSTGLVRTRCWRATTGSRAKAIRCAQRLAEAQATKVGHLFKP
ncbi:MULTISPECIES: hypothetical protein [Nocardioides]|uniref:Uncharacterized protein n=1 Tax=Nocardioides vastitatis TaxID=2568655 RepID=A0ABW0ZJ10_9ACTN|nr:hypothetical protein [Nocardioides sp.]THJ14722.1 hypothetical protein E7Z54_01325 [Nocardioides sp.]